MPPFVVDLKAAEADFPQYKFVKALTPSMQKAAFHVVDKTTGENLCLKIIAPNYSLERIEREIQALQAIQHANVVRLLEYTYSAKAGKNLHFLVEEFVEGDDLAAILIKGKAWDAKAVCEFFSKLADGLHKLGEANIVHRDIKPANIRVRPDKSPVLIDFGVCRHLDLPDLTLTIQGAGFGTPLYFSPEQFDGTKYDIDHRTDLFALGILIYEAITGESPFAHPSMTIGDLKNAVCASNVHLNKAAFKGLDPKWQLLISRMLEKERAKRPANAEQVAMLLRKLGGC